MTAATLPRTRTSPADSGDADVVHLWCCDENVAICGEDLTGESEADGSPDEVPCPLCETAVDEDRLCPVRGCRLRRLLRIGPWRSTS